jgi:hypothetical protein
MASPSPSELEEIVGKTVIGVNPDLATFSAAFVPSRAGFPYRDSYLRQS